LDEEDCGRTTGNHQANSRILRFRCEQQPTGQRNDCLVLSAICVFVAVERYNTNANNVRAISQFQQSSPFGGMMGGVELKPATPAATKYALFFAALSGVGGAVLLIKSGQPAA
jgi:hypothetical protein